MIRVFLCALVVSGCAGPESQPAGDPGRAGDPFVGDTSGDPVVGDPLSGDPIAGDPFSGDPFSGDPISGDPIPGDAFLLTPCGLVLPPVVVLEASVTELYEAINAGDTLAVVDVRTPTETANGIIENALLYPWPDTLQANHANLPDDRPLYIICASGSRSRQAAQWLVDNGHTCVHTVLSGMSAWTSAGYPTVIP